MVWHPAVSDHNPTAAVDFLDQAPGEAFVVTVVMKDLSTAIAPSDDMVDGIGVLKPGQSWYGQSPSLNGVGSRDDKLLTYNAFSVNPETRV